MKRGEVRILGIVLLAGLVAGFAVSALVGTVDRSSPVSITSWILGEGDTFRPKPKAMPKEGRTYGLEVWVSMPDMPRAKQDALRQWVGRVSAGVCSTFAKTRTAIRYIDEDALPRKLKGRTKKGNPPDVVFFSPANFGDYGVYQLQLQAFMSGEEKRSLHGNAVRASTRSGKDWIIGWPIGMQFAMWAVDQKALDRAGIDKALWAQGRYSPGELGDKALRAGFAALVAYVVPNRLMALDMPSLMDAKLDGGKPMDTPLWSFRTGTVPALAPVEPRLADALGAGAEGGPLLLASPVARPSGAVSAVSVFRGNRRHFKGFDHLRVCVELVRGMAEAAQAPDGPCRLMYLLPADKGQQPPPMLVHAADTAPNLVIRGMNAGRVSGAGE